MKSPFPGFYKKVSPAQKKDPDLQILRGRLLKGARILGEIWRSGDRCEKEWSRCRCRKNRTRFCEAKSRWLKIAESRKGFRELAPNGSYMILESMTVPEIEATKLKVKTDIPGAGTIRIGPDADYTWSQLLDISKSGGLQKLAKLENLRKVFPGTAVKEKETLIKVVW